MMTTLLRELCGPSPGMAGGLAAMTSGALGAALFVKCRYRQAEKEMSLLEELALKDGHSFEGYLQSKRAGEDPIPWLTKATESPLVAAETALRLLEQLPEARATCPRSMVSDLQTGAHLLEASCRCFVELAEANLRLFSSPWKEGETRLGDLGHRLRERDDFRFVFRSTKTIAVIGISEQSEKPAYYVPAYFKARGYQIWGVHPRERSSLADTTLARLSEFESPPDLALIFRRSDKVLEHLDDVLSRLPKTVWMQQGITCPTFSAALRARGVTVVSDRCAMVEHQKLCISSETLPRRADTRIGP